MLRSCYASGWNLPGVGVVRGYYYFSPPGTPFVQEPHFLGSANWHRGDGRPWNEYGEVEEAARSYRNGKFIGDELPSPRVVGDDGCLGREFVEVFPVTLRWGLPVECYQGVDVMPAGVIVGFGGTVATVPVGWLACDGAAVSRTYYGELFSALGVVWGVGDGVNTFNLPDLRGRSIVGSGTGAGLSPRALATAGGVEEHTLTIPELPAHDHQIGFIGGGMAGAPASPFVWAPTPPFLGPTAMTGNDQPHENMQPFAVCGWIIKAAGP